MPARLGIITGNLAAYGPGGALMINHANGRVFDGLRARFPGARLAIPVLPNVLDSMTHPLGFEVDDVVALPPLRSTIAAQKYYPATRRLLHGFARDCDLLFVKIPFQLPDTLRSLGKPKVLHAVTDPVECVACSPDYQGVRRLAAAAFARRGERLMADLVAEPSTRLVANGTPLWKKLRGRNGRIVVSSCLRHSEMDEPGNRPLHRRPRLLFVGYVRPEKGIHVLIDAFETLRATRPLELTIVGATDRHETGAESALRRRVAASPFECDIHLRGMMPFGAPLFDLYRSHDVLVCPSLSEGTPRVLVEARGFGCAVVASSAGGIPQSLTDGVDGLLVPPGDSPSLARAIARVLEDEVLRHKLVTAGHDSARRLSLDAFVAELADEVDALGHVDRARVAPVCNRQADASQRRYEHAGPESSDYRNRGRLLLDIVRRHVPAGGHILDVGCGSGHISVALARAGFQVTACDVSPRMVDIARRTLRRAGVAVPVTEGDCVDVAGVPRFDAVVAAGVLDRASQGGELIAQLSKCVRAGGLVAVSSRNRDDSFVSLANPVKHAMASVLARVSRRPNYRDIANHDGLARDVVTVVEMAEGAGLKVIETAFYTLGARFWHFWFPPLALVPWLDKQAASSRWRHQGSAFFMVARKGTPETSG
jgi:glycosyltransferase involved in cell wall biosynthesis/2-polyprenyl-3-methyl-5-hydroxy-6-metoxy-1,4-benzoquinol methylase